MPRKQVLIAGASGLVGYAAMRSFGADPDLGQGFLRTNGWFQPLRGLCAHRSHPLAKLTL
jgi:hypothetical protein